MYSNTSLCMLYLREVNVFVFAEGGRVEIGAPSGKWQMVVVVRGRHDNLDLTYCAALQHLMPEFEQLNVDVITVTA